MKSYEEMNVLGLLSQLVGVYLLLLHCKVPLADRTSGAMARYPTQSHYLDIEPASTCICSMDAEGQTR